MRIAFVTTLREDPWGASELLWSKTAVRALDAGHEVAVVGFRPKGPAPHLDDLAGRGANVLFRPQPGRWRAALERALRECGRSRSRALASLARWAPGLVVVSQGGTYQSVRDPALRAWLERPDTPPYALICHHNADEEVLSDADRATACAQFGRARWVAFVAEGNRRAAERQLASPIARAWIARSPVNLRAPEALAWPDDEIARFACVARLDARIKAQDVLLDVLGGAPWGDRRWHLDLYGRGPHLEYLKAVSRHRRIERRVTFHGYVPDVEPIWAGHHALVLPSRSEGTPLAALEAMLCARPSIVTDVGGLCEWIEEPVEGFVAASPSVRSFGDAMERAWAARGRWREIGLAAHERADRQRDPDPVGTLLTRILAP